MADIRLTAGGDAPLQSDSDDVYGPGRWYIRTAGGGGREETGTLGFFFFFFLGASTFPSLLQSRMLKGGKKVNLLQFWRSVFPVVL